MPRKRTIAPRACKVLWEHATPAPQDTAPAPFNLPAGFPRHLLDDDQLEHIESWWDTYAADILHALRGALTCARTRSTAAEKTHPVTLQNYIVHAVVLGHLLNLHPSLGGSLPQLAHELGVSFRRLYYARDAILEQLGHNAVAAVKSPRRATSAMAELLAAHPGLDYPRATRQGSHSYRIPYAGRPTAIQRFAIVQALSGHPGIASVRDIATDTGSHCLLVTLKS